MGCRWLAILVLVACSQGTENSPAVSGGMLGTNSGGTAGPSTADSTGTSSSTSDTPGSGTEGPVTSGSGSTGPDPSTSTGTPEASGSTGSGPAPYPACSLNDPPCPIPYDSACYETEDSSAGVCSLGCQDVNDCPIPLTGSAPVECMTVAGFPFCGLNCVGETCPDGMDCVDYFGVFACGWTVR